MKDCRACRRWTYCNEHVDTCGDLYDPIIYDEYEKISDEGYDAYNAGKDIPDCPYTGEKYYAWTSGINKAATQRYRPCRSNSR
jgi:hypothetical protein